MRHSSFVFPTADQEISTITVTASDPSGGYTAGEPVPIGDGGSGPGGAGVVAFLTGSGPRIPDGINIVDRGRFTSPQANPLSLGSGAFISVAYSTIAPYMISAPMPVASIDPRRYAARSRCSWHPGMAVPIVAPVYLSGPIRLGVNQVGPLIVTPTWTDDDGTHPVTIVEKHMERRLGQTKDLVTAKRIFIIQGSKDPFALWYFGPPIGSSLDFGPGMTASNREIKPYGGGDGISSACLLEVTYTAKQEQGDTNVPELSYEFGSEGEHIDSALGDPVIYGTDVEKVGRLINAHGGQVDGCEIEAPITNFTEEHVFSAADFNSGYRKLIHQSVQKINAGAFRDYQGGEVRFVGCRARKINLRQWSVVFNFSARRNVTNQEVTTWDDSDPPQPITVFLQKKGWQYVWASSTNIPGDTPSSPVKIRPRAYFVEDVYESLDFSILGIGTAPLG